jgi:glycosyltransferase involved in cell wall biosynthesis
MLSLIFPAFNEEKIIEYAVRETCDVLSSMPHIDGFEVLVIDDGSFDQTAAIVDGLGLSCVRCIRHAQNYGKGAAIQTGAKAAKGEWIAFFDCDLSVHPSLLSSFSFQDDFDVCIGSRRVPGACIEIHQPWYRAIAGRAFNLLVRKMFSFSFLDTQCGFKLFSSKANQMLFEHLHTNRWVFDVELLLKARIFHLSVREIPVRWRNGRESRVRFTHWVNIFKELIHLRKQYIK